MNLGDEFMIGCTSPIVTHEVCLSETIHCVVCVTIAHAPFADEPISTLRVHVRAWLWEAPVLKQLRALAFDSFFVCFSV